MTAPIGNSTTTQPASSQAAGSQSAFNQVDFLKMLTAQLQNQDPMAPQDNSQWMGQMAQFSVVQQVSAMNASNAKILASLDRSQTLSLIGRTVTYKSSTGGSTRGTVEHVDVSGDTASLTVSGHSGIAATDVTEVQ